ncbi:MAG: hypothetical protein WCR72_12710 [Bacteroidota bacterium]
MYKIILVSVLLSVIALVPSCRNGEEAGKNIVTKRIQYDVLIHNTEPDMDWWVQNIEGSSREKLVKDIIKQVTDGKVKAYDFLSCKPFTTAEIKGMMKRVDTISVERTTPPYDLVDTVMVSEIRLSDITKIRFLEEWSVNEKTLAITKKVAGICPLVERFSESGELRGYKPLFWVFFDDKYPAELELK